MIRKPRFCSQCGAELHDEVCDGRMRPVCSVCGHIAYLNPIPSVAAVLTKGRQILLVKRNIAPGKGKWCLPGGFMEAGETMEQAVYREVAEETGVACRNAHLLGAETVLGGFYGDVVVLCCGAEAFDGRLTAGGDADETRFFDVDDLPDIAFAAHTQFIMQYGRLDAGPRD
jgi:8-oxo-dGTP diphosphatase